MDNHFDLYGLPQRFHNDAAAIRSRYYVLSRQFHPDRYATADPGIRMEALRQAARNNEAYQMLSDPDRTMAYILKLHGVLNEEEKYTLPTAFLLEMMDLNEAVSDCEAAPADTGKKQAARSGLNAQLEQWSREVTPLLEAFDAGNQDTGLLLRIKDYYFRRKYLLRIQERLATLADPESGI